MNAVHVNDAGDNRITNKVYNCSKFMFAFAVHPQYQDADKRGKTGYYPGGSREIFIMEKPCKRNGNTSDQLKKIELVKNAQFALLIIFKGRRQADMLDRTVKYDSFSPV